MRRTLTACIFLGFGLAAIGVSGCKRHSAPVPERPVVRTLPPIKTEPDFPMGSLPAANVDSSAAARSHRASRPTQVQPVGPSQAETQVASDATQQRLDARLLQQQQAASRSQQQELNQQIQENVRAQQQIQDEPRIQEVPEVPITQPTQPGEEPQRIQEVPEVPIAPTQSVPQVYSPQI